MANNTQSVIIYRSKIEQQQDEMWAKFMDMHPEVGMVFFGLVIAAAVAVFGNVFYGIFLKGRFGGRKRW